MLTTLSVVDDELRVDTPNGPFWHRFSFDGYGETRDGGQWEITEDDTGTTLGRAWPLLTGERGEYAVTAGQDATPYLAAMAAAAGTSDMISEQVWDGREPDRRGLLPRGRGHPGRHSADVVARRAGAAGLDDAARCPRRPAGGGGTPLPALSVRGTTWIDGPAGFRFSPARRQRAGAPHRR